MDERRRHRYALELSHFVPQSASGQFASRHAELGDLEALAELMLDAYQATIDYDGEDLHDAQTEVASYLNANALLHCSVVVGPTDLLQAACLVRQLDSDHSALIAYVMTRTTSKRQGLARYTLNESLTCLKAEGYQRVLATITDGNTASERLFGSTGFVRVE